MNPNHQNLHTMGLSLRKLAKTVLYMLLLMQVTFLNAQYKFKNPNSNPELDSLINVVRTNLLKNNIQKSIEVSNFIIEKAETVDPKQASFYRAKGYNSLGAIHSYLKNPEDSEENWLKAIEYAEKLNDTLMLYKIYNNLGVAYAYKDSIDLKQSVFFYDKALLEAQKLQNEELVKSLYMNLSWAYFEAKDYENGSKYLLKIEGLIDEDVDPQIKIILGDLLGRHYAWKKEYDKAFEFYERGSIIGEKENILVDLSNLYLNYSRALKENGKIDLAYDKLNRHLELEEKLSNLQKVRAHELAMIKLNVKQYEKELESTKKEKIRQEKKAGVSFFVSIVIMLFSLVLLGLLISLMRNYKEKNRLSNSLKEHNAELEASKSEIEKLLKTKSNFFSTVSHELRTPLYGVIGLTTLLLESKGFNKQDRKYLESLKFSGDYLLNLINDVLQISKIESNSYKIKRAPFNIRQLIIGIVNSLKYNAKENDNELHYHIDENIPEIIVGDSLKLSQVIINLLANGLKFTEEGNVWLKLKLNEIDSNRIKIDFEIKDDGPGISEEHQKEIFETFYQIDNEHYEKGKGSGLGLTIVSKMLNQVNSKIILESEEGKGATFRFSLKFIYDKEISNEVLVPCHEKRKKYFSKPILIVEDNRINQLVTKNILKGEGIDAVVVDNGYDAIKEVEENDYSLVLMDLNMPGISGYETTERIREFNQDIPIVALTASTVEQISHKLIESGFNDIIIKPYDKNEFCQVLCNNVSEDKNNIISKLLHQY